MERRGCCLDYVLVVVEYRKGEWVGRGVEYSPQMCDERGEIRWEPESSSSSSMNEMRRLLFLLDVA